MSWFRGALARSVIAGVILLAPFASRSHAVDTIFITRHAEKAEFWPEGLDAYHPLSHAGTKRARYLARLLEKEGVEAIYATPTTRTLATGMPLVRKLGIPITASRESGDVERLDSFLAAVRKEHPGKGAVLIVGHADTVPQMLVRLGAEPSCFERLGIRKEGEGLRVDGYDGLWRVDLKEKGCARITRRAQLEGH